MEISGSSGNRPDVFTPSEVFKGQCESSWANRFLVPLTSQSSCVRYWFQYPAVTRHWHARAISSKMQETASHNEPKQWIEGSNSLSLITLFDIWLAGIDQCCPRPDILFQPSEIMTSTSSHHLNKVALLRVYPTTGCRTSIYLWWTFKPVLRFWP